MGTITRGCHHDDLNNEGLLTKRQAGEPTIFTEEDNLEVQFLHNDAVVIILNIKNYDFIAFL